MRPSFWVLAALMALPSIGFSQTAARFSGGTCVSQGTWVQDALDQSGEVIKAIQTLLNDENCRALTDILKNPPKIETGKTANDKEVASFSQYYQELQAIKDYIRPSAQVEGMSGSRLREIVNYLVFRKSFNAIRDIQTKASYDGLSPMQKDYVDQIRAQMESFLGKAKVIAEVTVETTRQVLKAYPRSQLCFSNKPSEKLTIFSALVSSTAAVLSGSEKNTVGGFIGDLINFNRDMGFYEMLSVIEKERFRASASCLIETTQESFCGLQDAQDALDYMRGDDGASLLADAKGDLYEPLQDPMTGLMRLLRDVPKVTKWMQMILFGIDPQVLLEAKQKNENWQNVMSFIQSSNLVLGNLRDMRQIYYESTQGKSLISKQAQLKSIVDKLVTNITDNPSRFNFYFQAVPETLLPFYLLGMDTYPEGFNPQMKTWSAIYAEWQSKGEKVQNPDQLLDVVEARLNKLMDEASAFNSNFFASRIINDPQNLIVEGMSGPDVSPYLAMVQIRQYFKDLAWRLEKNSGKEMKIPSANVMTYKSTIMLLNDSILRIDGILKAMEELANLKNTNVGIDSNRAVSRRVMQVIYESANMLVSRDSLLSTRVATAVRNDISDTLWRNEHLNPRQSDLLASTGKDLISRLSAYFSGDPVLKRLDISQAMPIHQKNLSEVEDLFGSVLYENIVDLNCQLEGGSSCREKESGLTPYSGTAWLTVERALYSSLAVTPLGGSILLAKAISDGSMAQIDAEPTTDAPALIDLRAKLCIQSLGFAKRDQFEKACRGAVLRSEFSKEKDPNGLNLSYDQKLKEIRQIRTGKGPSPISQSQIAGVCALRSYIRKNAVFRMYNDYTSANAQ